MQSMYNQYINRLLEWTDGYLDLIAARIEFHQLLEYGFSFEEAFSIVVSSRSDDYGKVIK